MEWPHVDPMPASVLADKEQSRRDKLRGFGPFKTGCDELDRDILLGGFDRGSVVGISTEDEDNFGLPLALKLVAKSVREDSSKAALIITPRPYSSVAKLLRDMIAAELAATGYPVDDVQQRTRVCLGQVMLSSVFDIDGVWQTLAELESLANPIVHTQQEQSASNCTLPPNTYSNPAGSMTSPTEVGDSEDEELSQKAEHAAADFQRNGKSMPIPKESHAKAPPDIVVVTHFSTFLTTLFTERERSAAHMSLLLLKSHLRFLTRSLNPNPLVLVLNSTATEVGSTGMNSHFPAEGSPKQGTHSDRTLRSVFSEGHAPLQGPNYAISGRSTKPSYGLIFSQLLDLHILCTNISRVPSPQIAGDAHMTYTQQARRNGLYSAMIEVLLDDTGPWDADYRPIWRSREQRWGVCRLSFGLLAHQ